MKINIVSFYFPPEKGAASQRIWNMAQGLKKEGNEVLILCPHPNYPTGRIFKGYGSKIIEFENLDGISVRRHWLYPSNSKKGIVRLVSMLSFSFSLFFSLPYLLKRKAQVTIVNSPPLFTGAGGVLVAKLLKCKCVLNVSDLWPRSALDLGALKPGKTYRILERLEYWMYKKADLILTQSEESMSYIESKKAPAQKIIYRNLPASVKTMSLTSETEPFKIIYAGLLGVAQGVYELIKNVDFKALGVELHIYGEGNERQDIENFLSQKEDSSIYYHGFVSPKKLESFLPGFNASLIPLVRPIYGAFPSKIFNAMMFGLPILFSGDGEGKAFVEKHEIGLTNKPGDYSKLSQNILSLKMMDDSEYDSLRKRCVNLLQSEFSQERQLRHLIINLDKLVYEK
jgi:glycosyltransferase involved in cell wall biosynthesis